MSTFFDLNAALNLWGEDGGLQLEKDKEAARAYFLEYVNQNTVFFHTLEEKVQYLVENNLWDEGCLYRFSWDETKALFQYAYSFKFRFQTFMGAYKFYTQYALKTPDGGRFLERYEDRVVLNALCFSTDYEHARSIVEEIISGRFQPATPTFLNAGRAQGGEPVSCFLLRISDSMESISRGVTDSLQLSKRGGGVALCLTDLRESGAPIKGVEGQASGVVPVMKILEDSFSYANQLGQRSGAGAVYLHAHHPDIMKFLDTKRENADEKVRIKTLSLGVVVPDITFELARENKDMCLFSPYDVERVFGKPFSDVNVSEVYYDMVDDPRIRKTKVNARKLFSTIAEIQFESGYPYLMFEDTVNFWNPTPNLGKITHSNLCVTADTRILTDLGYKTMGDLYESQQDFRVVCDERARLRDVAADGVSVQTSTRVVKTGENKPVFRVETVEGFELTATEDHIMFVFRGGEIVEVPLGQLRFGDKLVVPEVGRPDQCVFRNVELAFLCGFASKWFVPGEQPVLHYRADSYNKKVARYVERAAAFVLRDRDDLRGKLEPRWNHDSRRGGWELSSKPLNTVLKENNWSQYEVPDWLWQSDDATIQAYLDGLFDNDWLFVAAEHKGFLRDVQLLTACIGKRTRIYKSINSGWFLVLESATGYATVQKVEHIGDQDVYDVGVENGNSVIFNGIATHQCSEILQSSSPSTFLPDGSFDHVGKDISCNLGSLNVAKMWQATEEQQLRAVATAYEFLHNVSVQSNLDCSPTVAHGNEISRAIGLGQMNLHGAFIELGVDYDSELARVLFDTYMAFVTLSLLSFSSAKAEQTSKVFQGFWDSEYVGGKYVRRVKEHYDKIPVSERGLALSVSGATIPVYGPSEWDVLADRVAEFGLANSHLQAVPPTGSISYINNATASIHPITSPIEIRKEGKIGRVYYPCYGLTGENLFTIKTAYELGPEPIIDMYAQVVPYVDQGLSLTLFFKDTATTRDINRAQIYAWKKGVKTVYYVRLRQKALTGTEVDECVSCSI